MFTLQTTCFIFFFGFISGMIVSRHFLRKFVDAKIKAIEALNGDSNN